MLAGGCFLLGLSFRQPTPHLPPIPQHVIAQRHQPLPANHLTVTHPSGVTVTIDVPTNWVQTIPGWHDVAATNLTLEQFHDLQRSNQTTRVYWLEIP
jgi:hypothetical protein